MSKLETQRWIAIAREGDVEPSDVRRCEVEGRCIALFNLDGRLYATADICTHAHAHLSDGYIDGDTAERLSRDRSEVKKMLVAMIRVVGSRSAKGGRTQGAGGSG